LTALKSIKSLVYAGDILTFTNSKEKSIELQERLKVYRVVFNSQVNYSTSTACPSAGGYMFNKREFKELMVNNDLK
jgi:hypothetical protein